MVAACVCTCSRPDENVCFWGLASFDSSSSVSPVVVFVSSSLPFFPSWFAFVMSLIFGSSSSTLKSGGPRGSRRCFIYPFFFALHRSTTFWKCVAAFLVWRCCTRSAHSRRRSCMVIIALFPHCRICCVSVVECGGGCGRGDS